MQYVWNHEAPLWNFYFYLQGAPNVACTNRNVTTSWFSQVSGQQGGITQYWGLEPVWVGAQAPYQDGSGHRCYPNRTFGQYLPNDTNAAYTEGHNEAQTALIGANGILSLGWTGTGQAIALDIEGFSLYPGCLSAVNAFVSGWDQYLQTGSSIQSSVVYSSASVLAQLTSIQTVPQEVWMPSHDCCGNNVWNEPGLNNVNWSYDQRHSQWAYGQSENLVYCL